MLETSLGLIFLMLLILLSTLLVTLFWSVLLIILLFVFEVLLLLTFLIWMLEESDSSISNLRLSWTFKNLFCLISPLLLMFLLSLLIELPELIEDELLFSLFILLFTLLLISLTVSVICEFWIWMVEELLFSWFIRLFKLVVLVVEEFIKLPVIFVLSLLFLISLITPESF